MPASLDDKSEHCIPFILERLDVHRRRYAGDSNVNKLPPFILGLNGVQGAGKTTLVTSLCNALQSSPYYLATVFFSIDDLYLTHDAQLALAAANPANKLVQHRGEPGTHDVRLGVSILQSLLLRQSTRIPSYDKSAFGGQGDRTDLASWTEVNGPGQETIEVVIFEGWCVGFRTLDEPELRNQWEHSRAAKDDLSRLWRHDLDSLIFVNDKVKFYDDLTDKLNALIHIDAKDLQYVYEWRLEQEKALRQTRGSGMTDAEVRRFVDGYYPAYELYTDKLRRGVIRPSDESISKESAQLRLVIGRDRRVITTQRI